MEKYQNLKDHTLRQRSLGEYGHYGENNGPIDDWIKRNRDDPCDVMMPMSKPGDKDYEL